MLRDVREIVYSKKRKYMLIEMENFTVEVIRKRIKNVNLRINAQGKVTVSAPMRYPSALIHAYLEEKQNWINGHRMRLQKQSHKPVIAMENGKYLHFLGKYYTIMRHENFQQAQVILDEGILHIYTTSDMTLSDQQYLLQNWYRHQMSQLLPELIKKWSVIIGVEVTEYRIKIMKTRWGSCNRLAKRIWLNLNLIHKSLECLEYVIVHELVHLHEPSHNKRFYALMSHFMPSWKYHQKQLYCDSVEGAARAVPSTESQYRRQNNC
jgi:predicted metal-dependent hydrolase